jgi:antitoxin YefM
MIFKGREQSRPFLFQNLGSDFCLDTAYEKTYASYMTTISASQARSNLYRLLDKVTASHRPIQISGKRSNGVLISEEDWESIQETLYLLSIPGMRESIRKSLKTSVKKCSKELPW